ncbi:hypothetical protein GIB67_011734 [Kingdonia uniflora]|uniref:TF-B3 domain-containing protein n=1 Tax=Kingdonia uniflora TaxID=39325 RepID=A0A7J7LUP5_9MAGN|nr:hypothetical protein GIB67_011734 [Kingdonia uniflora]
MLNPPTRFCNEYLSKEDVIFTLVDENEEPFTVRFPGRKFSVGWKAFSTDINLVERDALVFGLVKPAKFQAYIITDHMVRPELMKVQESNISSMPSPFPISIEAEKYNAGGSLGEDLNHIKADGRDISFKKS